MSAERPGSSADRYPTVRNPQKLTEKEALEALADVFGKWRHVESMTDHALAALALSAVCFPLADGSVPAHPWAIHQRDLLASALGRVLVAAGAAAEQPMTGPELLLLADDYVEHRTGVRP